MAAITPHLEQQNDPSESREEKQYDRVRARRRLTVLQGLGQAPHDAATDIAAANHAVQVAHSNLVATAWTRRAIEQELEGRTITVAARGRELMLELDVPIAGPLWNPAGAGGIRKASVLSWTKKMGCPSFSLPAGPPEFGGSCPGATGGQSIVPEPNLRKGAAMVQAVTGQTVNLADAVCEWCLAGDTRVMVRDRGLVRLDALDPREEIEVWSGIAWRRTRVVAQGVRELVELETTWGQRVRMTPDHKVLTSAGMVEVQELLADDALPQQLPGETPFPKVAPLPVALATKLHPNACPAQWPTDWSFDLGQLLGYIVADGCISGDRYPQIVFTKAAEDQSDLDQLVKIVQRWCDTDTHVRVGPATASGFASAPAAQARLNFRVKGLVQFILTLGVDKLSPPEQRRLPTAVWTASADAVRGFLSGFFSCDGSISVAPDRVEVSAAQVSRGLLEDVQHLLAAFGIRSTICEYSSNRRRGYLPLWKLSISADAHVRRFGADIGLVSDRKAARLAAALAAVAEKPPRQTSPGTRAVRALGISEPVFDLVDVGEEHQFLGNGVSLSNCYAEGGNYRYGSKQLAQVILYMWTRRAVADGSFVPALNWAIRNADFHLEATNTKKLGQYPAEERGKFFRLHDSGDFFSPEYLRAWKQIANDNPDVMFWAPSRYWAAGRGAEFVDAINTPQNNLIIRPSAFMVDSAAPRLGSGWAGGSTVFDLAAKPGGGPFHPSGTYNWDCQAYAVEEEAHTCRHATAPDGRRGCRACWLNPEYVVNYTKH